MRGTSIPILTYHRIAEGEKLDLRIFEAHLKVLADSGLPSLLPDDLQQADKGFVLTFDDGFADCWTHVFPLLLKYGLRAVIFVIPAKTGDGPLRAPGERVFPGNASQAHEEACARPGPHDAFLRWSEMAEMEKSGLVAIQSHSLEHRSIWGGDRVTGFNLGTANKTHWSLAQITDGDVRLGIPVYQRGSAIGCRRFHDDRELREVMAGWLEERGGAAFIADQGVKATEAALWEVCRAYLQKADAKGEWESPAHRAERTRADIVGARKLLEDRLGGVRDELCLPWGEYDAVTLECAKQAGVRRVYTLDRGPNPARSAGFLLQRFEPRPRGPVWLKSRLWIYASIFRSLVYARLSPRESRSKKGPGTHA